MRAAHLKRAAWRKGGQSRREQFAEIALPLMDTAYSAAMYLARNPDDAAELLQDTFLRAYQFRTTSSFAH